MKAAWRWPNSYERPQAGQIPIVDGRRSIDDVMVLSFNNAVMARQRSEDHKEMPMTAKTILIVDDEAAIRDMIAMALELAGYRYLEAANVQDAHAAIIDHRPDLILLDWMLPGTSGVQLARRLKQDPITRELPIILLTAKSEEDSKIQGLEAGADDYITKPFSPRELVARLKALLRRTTPDGIEKPVTVDGLTLNPASHRVHADDQELQLGPTEFRLLQFFMTHQERAYTRDQLLDQVWGGNVYIDERTVDVHVRRLRKTLGPRHESLIQTVRGLGYRFSAPQGDH